MSGEPCVPPSAFARERLAGRLAGRDVDLLTLRIERFWPDLVGGLSNVYSGATLPSLLHRLARLLCEHYAERPEDLRLLDLRRQLEPDWLLSPRQLGYVCYVDRFAGTLRGIATHLDHLEELGVTYLHLMPLLAPRPGNSDGGYAVADFRRVDARLGNLEDLEALAAALRARGISLCIDLVLNHVAAEHVWAQRARAGDLRYRDYFHTFADRSEPERFEETLPEVFPAFAPGNFSWDQALGRWVWTTFNAFQWDLDWANPAVFCEFVDLILFLAARGVEVFRLDAIAFLWKRLGTACQNQPEVHAIVQALRAATRIAAPAVAFKAEAIVAPAELVSYLGQGPRHGKVSQLAYHNTLMVQVWSSLATRDTRLARRTLAALPEKPADTAWATYLRCHDDIGWAIDDRHAADVGWQGPAHRRFLADYYAGVFAGSHARGEVFQDNPRTGDRRTCGTTASLLGLERALEHGDLELATLAIERILLGHAVILAFGGIPLLYMGDELGLLNDYAFRDDHDRARDNRWLHRPPMDWAAAARARQAGTVEHRIHSGLRQLIATRKATPQLHAAAPVELLDAGNDHVLAFARVHHQGRLVALFNCSERDQAVPLAPLPRLDRISGQTCPTAPDGLWLPPYGRLWLVDP